MDPSTYTRIQQAVEEALRSDSSAWAGILTRYCGTDQSMAAKVERLIRLSLDEEEEEGAFSEEVLLARRRALDEALDSASGTGAPGDHDAALPDSAWLPEEIDDYRIERTIGRGGAGVVFLAKQKRPERLVALKLLSPSASTGETVERLEREAEILGALQHPGIAQIFEAGSFDGGFGIQPYLVMEWIDGPRITDYAKLLGRTERVRLMIDVAAAVEHAHARGVIHRDLKPDNVLVDKSGQPKLVTWVRINAVLRFGKRATRIRQCATRS